MLNFSKLGYSSFARLPIVELCVWLADCSRAAPQITVPSERDGVPAAQTISSAK